MSDRLPSAAGISIGTYYGQQHQQQHHQQQQQQHPTALASAMAKSTMHFPSALQQRLHDYQPPSNGYETPRYHSAAAASGAAGGNYEPAFSPYGPLHYGTGGGGGLSGVGVGSPAFGQSYADQQPQPHPHYDSTYNGRLIGGGVMGGFYGGRDRYFPYPPHHAQQQKQQQHRHTMRGMFTPAGQQLVPSSVLHYLPRGAAYQRPPPLPQQTHLQPQQQQRHPDSSLYARNEPQLPQPQQLLQHYPQRSPYLQMHLNGTRPPSPTPTPTPSPSPASALTPIPSPSLSHNVRPASVGYNPYQPLQQHQQQQQPAASPRGVDGQQAITATHPQRHHQQQQQHQQQQHQQQQQLQMYTENRCNSSSSSSDLPNTSEQSFMNADCKDDAQFGSTHITPSATAPFPAAPIANHLNASTVSSPTSSAAPPLGDCLTTSPPLISATGTDSGISSCSTRARSDSTQSTPVYSGEYPNSVGSSSGVSYHCADVKDFEELNKEKEDVTVGENDAKAQRDVGDGDSCMAEVKKETFDDEDMVKMKMEGEDVASGAEARAHQTEPNAIQAAEEVSNAASSAQQQIKAEDQTPNSTASQPRNASRTTHNSSRVDAHGSECSNTTPTEAGNTSVSVSGTSMNASSADERSATPTRHAPSSPTTQPQQQQQPPLHRSAPIPMCVARSAASLRDSSWPPFPDSPNSWTQQSNGRQLQLEQSSPPVPVPPHNSPVDYAPSPTYPAAPATPATAPLPRATTTALAASLVSKKHKNRIMECDLIPSRKSKRKSSSAERAAESDAREEMRDMTPLPGFQQAFGSTEIGRFFESFLLRPADSNVESVDAFDMEQQLQLQQQQQQQQQLQQHQQQLQHQQQQQPHHYAADYLGSVYEEGGYHQRPHHHSAYYNRQVYAQSYHHHLWPHARPSPYDAYEYGMTRSGTAGGAGGMAPFNFHFGSGYSAMRDMLSLERMGYSYGRLNGGYGGIRCNGY